jgi:trk system potassium uptake protein TrkH
MSAWTGTGLTMMTNLEGYHHILLFCRAWMQWLGGIGIVLVALTVLIRPGVAAARLYRAEAMSERILPNLVNTSKVIFQIYLVLTLLGVYLYYINGMSPFDALTHSMTGLGTGGMSTHDLSIGYFNSTAIEAVTIFLMIMGAVNFTVHYRMFVSRHLKPFFDDIQVRYMFLFLVPAVGITAYSLYQAGDGVGDSLRQSVFHSVSAITCTGFGIADIGRYPELGKLIIGILMVIGGGAGSTAGGIKLIRVTLMYESLKWTLQQAILPRGAVIRRKVGNYIFTDEDVQEVMSFTMTYIAFLLFGTIYTMIRMGTGFVDSFFEIASAQGNVGLSVGITSSAMPADMKVLLILHMWIGRLEIFSTLVFIISALFLVPRVVGRK